MRCPDDTVKEELRKIGNSRKNQDHMFRWHGNYDYAIEEIYINPPSFICSTHGQGKGEKEEREGEGREERKEVRKFWRSWKQNRDSRVLLS